MPKAGSPLRIWLLPEEQSPTRSDADKERAQGPERTRPECDRHFIGVGQGGDCGTADEGALRPLQLAEQEERAALAAECAAAAQRLAAEGPPGAGPPQAVAEEGGDGAVAEPVHCPGCAGSGMECSGLAWGREARPAVHSGREPGGGDGLVPPSATMRI